MSHRHPSPTPASPTNRRAFLRRAASASAVALVTASTSSPRSSRANPTPTPGDRDWSGHNPVRYPDPDLLILDPRFGRYRIGNTPIQRIHTGNLWAEGPAWNAVGRYLLWSDIPNDLQRRWLEEDQHISTFRTPAGNSNGNTFDYEGRQIACEHGTRRVVRYEHSGATTVLADSFDGKPFNAPNDAVVHPDGGIWFTDPGYGSMGFYEGNKGPLHLKEAIYRIDPRSGRIDKVADDIHKPNGLCFSPDYRTLYVADSGGPNPKPIKAWDVVDARSLRNGRVFTSMAVSAEQAVAYQRANPQAAPIRAASGGADGIRCDVDGNVWASAGWAGPGYDGVHVFAPDGDRIGMILLPEICSNVCFGGTKRNRLFMTASQSVYAVYVETRGAHIT